MAACHCVLWPLGWWLGGWYPPCPPLQFWSTLLQLADGPSESPMLPQILGLLRAGLSYSFPREVCGTSVDAVEQDECPL